MVDYYNSGLQWLTFNFDNASCAAILLATFLLGLIAQPLTMLLVQPSLASTTASTKKSPFRFAESGKLNSKLWVWQSSCSSLIELSCKQELEKFMIGSKKANIILQASSKLNLVSKSIAAAQDSTKSPSTWINETGCNYKPVWRTCCIIPIGGVQSC